MVDCVLEVSDEEDTRASWRARGVAVVNGIPVARRLVCIRSLLAPVVVALLTAGLASPAAGSEVGYSTIPIVCDRWASPSGNDAAAGSEAAPYLHVTYLLLQLGEGQTGCLKDGEYNTGADANVTVQTPGVTLASAPGERATLKTRLWIKQGADGVTVVNLNLVGLGTLPSSTVNANGVLFTGNDVTNQHETICLNVGSKEGYGEAAGTVIEWNRIHDCGRLPATNQDHGIYVDGATDTVVRNNWIYDNADRGVQLFPSSQGTEVSQNIIDGNGTGVIISGNGTWASSNNLVEDNVITNSQVRWNVESDWPGGLVGTGNFVRANCLYASNPRAIAEPDEYGYFNEFAGLQQPSGNPDSNGEGFTAEENDLSPDAPEYINRAGSDFNLQPGSPCAGKGPETEEEEEGGEVVCQGQPATIIGTSDPDELAGTPGDDVIAAGAGDDTISGEGGKDLICGEGGDDTLEGGPGDDTLEGGGGYDSADGGPGADEFNVERVDYSSAIGPMEIDLDTMRAFGPDGMELVHSAYDAIGSSFDDTIYATFIGGTLDGGAGEDELVGSSVDDILIGGLGYDTMRGAGGDDQLIAQGGGDAVKYTYAPSSVDVDLAEGIAIGEGTDTLSGVNEVYGSPYDDTLRGAAPPGGQVEFLYGDEGDDLIEGRGGPDLLNGAIGDDTVVGGAGPDDLRGGAGADSMLAQDGEVDLVDCGDDADPEALVDPVDAVTGCEIVGTPPEEPPGYYCPTSATCGIELPPRGTAHAVALARVSRGKALLKLRCAGPGNCSGEARLTVPRRGGARRHRQTVRLGAASFAIPVHRHRTVRVRLSRSALRLVRRRGRRGVVVRLTGDGVAGRTVKLVHASKRRYPASASRASLRRPR